MTRLSGCDSTHQMEVDDIFGYDWEHRPLACPVWRLRQTASVL